MDLITLGLIGVGIYFLKNKSVAPGAPAVLTPAVMPPTSGTGDAAGSEVPVLTPSAPKPYYTAPEAVVIAAPPVSSDVLDYVNTNVTLVESRAQDRVSEIPITAVIGEEPIAYDWEAVEAGTTGYSAQWPNYFVRSGYWKPEVLDHILYWNAYWMRRNMGLEPGYPGLWAGDPLNNLKVLFGVDSYQQWYDTFKADLYKGL